MANTYYDSQLTAAEIEAALEAISGLIVPANNGKVIAINNGKFEARSVQWGSGYPEPVGTKQITANGTGIDVKDYAFADVAVPGGGYSQDYVQLINSACAVLGGCSYSNAGYYLTANLMTGSPFLLPNGNVACSAEVYFDADNVGYLLGFGQLSTRNIFSFTPSKFVSFSDDHNFTNQYLGKHHFVVVYDGNTGINIYVDGSLAETFALGGVLTIGVGYLFQGKWANTSLETFSGDIYYTRIWKKALTAQEASVLYQNRDA